MFSFRFLQLSFCTISTVRETDHGYPFCGDPLALAGKLPEGGTSAERNCAEKIIKCSSKKKEHKPKLSGPDIFRWGGGLPREGIGAKRFGMSLETREIKHFGGKSRFCWEIPGAPEKFEKEMFVFNFWLLQKEAQNDISHRISILEFGGGGVLGEGGRGRNMTKLCISSWEVQSVCLPTIQAETRLVHQNFANRI